KPRPFAAAQKFHQLKRFIGMFAGRRHRPSRVIDLAGLELPLFVWYRQNIPAEIFDVFESRHLPSSDRTVAADVAVEKFLASFLGDPRGIVNALVDAADALKHADCVLCRGRIEGHISKS